MSMNRWMGKENIICTQWNFIPLKKRVRIWCSQKIDGTGNYHVRKYESNAGRQIASGFFLHIKPVSKLIGFVCIIYCGYIDYRTISEMMEVGTLKEGQVYQGNMIHVTWKHKWVFSEKGRESSRVEDCGRGNWEVTWLRKKHDTNVKIFCNGTKCFAC